MEALLTQIEPMGIYQTLYKFLNACEKYMGDPGTIPLSQGFPLVTQVPEGPEVPTHLEVTLEDRMYPKAWGNQVLREALATYYNNFYEANITPENIMIFAGGRPGLMGILGLLNPKAKVLIEETEYTPYYDMLELLGKNYQVLASNPQNSFACSIEDYKAASDGLLSLSIKSNPCNPTGINMTGDQLQKFVDLSRTEGRAILLDEAYEFFNHKPESGLRYIKDIDQSNLFICGAATKGLQVPGFRVGWVIASKDHINTMANYSSFAMGGVNGPAQRGVAKLLELERVTQARNAIGKFYGMQRERYGNELSKMGFELYTGEGGFYHWGRLPNGMNAEEFNQKLFRDNAAILPGPLCDMHRRGEQSPLANFIRLSFGPRNAEDFEGDIAVLQRAVQ